ncbi:MAG: hypothetical protein WAN65_01205 [Candidatus Sulfotelmatobacter sp.]
MRAENDCIGPPDGPATIDGATSRVLPTPHRRKPQLTSMEGVRVEMARVYREMESGKRDSQDGSRLVYVLTQIAKLLELTEIERRIIVLEDRATNGRLPQTR